MRRRRFVQTAAALGVASVASVWPTARALLAEPSPSVESSLSPGWQASVTADSVNLRGGPGVRQPVVGTLDSSMLVDLLAPSADGAWWRVANDALVGYVSAELLQATGRPASSPVFDLDLTIPYARQQSPIWCDPADLEMWLGYRQGAASTGGAARLQSAIWDWETTHNAGFRVDQWDCSPYAVASAAHHWMPDIGVDHFQYDDPLGGSRVLAWLLSHPAYREPSIALIWRGLHYVLVRGVRAIGNPAEDPGGVELLGFYVADPDPGASFWLGEDRFIPLPRWLNELFSPVSYLTPHTGVPGDVWQNRAVAIQRTWTAGGPTDAGQRNASVANYA